LDLKKCGSVCSLWSHACRSQLAKKLLIRLPSSMKLIRSWQAKGYDKAMAISEKQEIFLRYDDIMHVYSKDGTYLRKWNCDPNTSVAASQTIYTRSWVSGQIKEYSGNGEFLSQWKGPSGEYLAVYGRLMYLTTDREVLVYDTSTGKVVRGFSGGEKDGASKLTCVAVSSDEVYVINSGNGHLQVFSKTGVFLRQWSILPSDFYRLAITSDAVCLYGIGQDRFQVFDKEGRFLFDHPVKNLDALVAAEDFLYGFEYRKSQIEVYQVL